MNCPTCNKAMRKVRWEITNNFKVGKLFPISVFVQVEYWYGVRERVGAEFFTYSKKYYHTLFNYSIKSIENAIIVPLQTYYT